MLKLYYKYLSFILSIILILSCFYVNLYADILCDSDIIVASDSNAERETIGESLDNNSDSENISNNSHINIESNLSVSSPSNAYNPMMYSLMSLSDSDVLEWSGSQSGGELSTDVILVGDTYMESLITIPSNTSVTIDLNGYMLHGCGSDSVIKNNGQLTIIDSRPDYGSHIFKRTSTGPWELDDDGDYEVVGGLITGGLNKSSSGGGAITQNSYVYSNVLYIEGGTLVGNSSSRAGGAVYGGSIIMSGGSVIGNYAESFAGGLCVSGKFEFLDGLIGYNETSINSSYNNPNNTSYFDNADVLIGSRSSFNMTGGKIIGTLTSDWYGDANASFFKFSGGEIDGHFRVINGLNANISGGTIKGSVYIRSGKCVVSDTALIYGGSEDNGGSVYVDGGTFEMSGGVIRDSSAVNGGAVCVENGSVSISGGLIKGCSASNGGAIYLKGGNFNMSDGIIESNSASMYGGGVYVSGGNININGGSIYNNDSSDSGGGIYITSDNNDFIVDIYSGSIINNYSGENGGGLAIDVDSNSNVDITIGLVSCLGVDENHIHPVIESNTSEIQGGGLYLNGDESNITLDIYCGSIDNNLANYESSSDNVSQTGGLMTWYNGNIGQGLCITGGTLLDERIGASDIDYQIIYNPNYVGCTDEEKVAIITENVEICLPAYAFIRDGYYLIGWCEKPVPDSNSDIILVGMNYRVKEDKTLYAIWSDEEPTTSYIVYIPDRIDINESRIADMEISIEMSYFPSNANLSLFVNKGDSLLLENNNQIGLSYELLDNNVKLNDGDMITTWSLRQHDPKLLEINVLSDVVYSGVYTDVLTFSLIYND